MSHGILFRSRQDVSDFKLMGSTGTILERVQIIEPLFITFKDISFSNENHNQVRVRPVSVQNCVAKIGAEKTINFDDLHAVIANTFIPRWVQINNQNLNVVNNPEVIDWSSKSIQSQNLLEYIPTHIVKPTEFINDEILHSKFENFEFVVVKPEKGMNGTSVKIVKKDLNLINKSIETIRTARAESERSEVDILVQPFMPPSRIENLKGIDSENQKRLEELDSALEVRIYVALKSDWKDGDYRQFTHAIGRNVNPWEEKDVWINIRQDTVPEEMFKIAFESTKKVMNTSLSKGLFVAVDMSMYKNKFYIVEMNVRDPAFPDSIENPADGPAVIKNYLKLFE